MTKWYSIADAPMRVCGLGVHADGVYHRLPEDVAKAVSPGVAGLAKMTSGGRVRFRTDSPTVRMRYTPADLPLFYTTVSVVGKSCVDCYVDGVFRGVRPPEPNALPFDMTVRKNARMQDVDLYLPYLNRIVALDIGVEDGAAVEAPRPYTIEKPVVFYGSSITHGLAASRAGLTYPAQVARALDADFFNFGFSGAARGEEAMARYIAGMEMSAFVYDYDHNAPNVEYLQNTYAPFFRIIREAQPELPIVMVTKPDTANDPADAAARCAVVRATYDAAVAAGDRNVAFIDGDTLFGTADRDACTVDGCHPNDLGFYRMAQGILPVLRGILG